MFGIRYVKFDPSQHVILFRNGRAAKEGPGLAFWYLTHTGSIVAVPLSSSEAPFFFDEVTSDFQEVTVQGNVTYRISDPHQATKMLNYTLDARAASYVSKDPEKLQQRIVNVLNQLVSSRIKALPLQEALVAQNDLVTGISAELQARSEIQSLGVEILGLTVLSIKPTPETARALEAETRENLLKRADDAVFERRNASVEQERSIKENELLTEKTVQEKEQELEKASTTHRIELEDSRKDLVALEAENAKAEADSRAYALEKTLAALAASDPEVVKTLAQVGLDPDRLVAAAMQEFAANADKIGELNLSPKLLRELLDR